MAAELTKECKITHLTASGQPGSTSGDGEYLPPEQVFIAITPIPLLPASVSTEISLS
jgi:hypothetical protein